MGGAFSSAAASGRYSAPETVAYQDNEVQILYRYLDPGDLSRRQASAQFPDRLLKDAYLTQLRIKDVSAHPITG